MTTAASLAPDRDVHNAQLPAAPPPRKRRRRTATSGATDDCFTCRRRAQACDRKRPYCSQCIEIGKECSGYKTTLTWGVGVASRGKLRGLSCPVTQKQGESTTTAAPAASGQRRRKSSVNRNDGESANARLPASSSSQPHRSAPPPLSTQHATSAAHVPSAPIAIAVPSEQNQQHQHQHQYQQQHQHAWRLSNLPTIPDQSHHGGDMQRTPFHDPMPRRLQTSFPVHQYSERGMPHSAASMSSYAENDFHSPIDFPQTPGSMPFAERLQPNLSNSYGPQTLMGSPVDNISLHSASIGSYPDTLSSSIDTLQSVTAPFPDHLATPHDPALGSFGVQMMVHGDMLTGSYGDGQMAYSNFTHLSDHFPDEESEHKPIGMDLLDSRFSSPFFHIPPRMQSLLDFYDQHVCPVIVAFDGPENPYRKHILQLAIGNEGLQNAIAALATNNSRMRQHPPPRQMGFVEEILDGFGSGSGGSVSEPTQEESYYKQMSIEQLNMQLADTRAAQDDSVLATLLILCLFHVCDSGFSKFKTQLAGVQKLLTLRDPAGQSDFTRWVEMFFIWFDVMTSTVNDREMQIKPESLDMLDFSANLGALEQFSGCDGRLFKLIARLGRLNLLAQGRPVRRQDGMEAIQQRPVQRKFPMRNRPLTARDFENIDGNGWGTPIAFSGRNSDNAANSGQHHFQDPNIVIPDNRRDFWIEWHDIRNRLSAWEMDPSTASASLPSTSQQAAADLEHINESFRYSALLYTERLGYPLLPGSHPNFQRFVSQTLYHITALPVTSCVNKFLLWPLFITGTECVDPSHRAIIRSRCVEVQQESGFFNNLSSLEVLERVWHDSDCSDSSNLTDPAVSAVDEDAEINARRRDSEAARTGLYGPAFRWRKAMTRIDGEYIII